MVKPSCYLPNFVCESGEKNSWWKVAGEAKGRGKMGKSTSGCRSSWGKGNGFAFEGKISRGREVSRGLKRGGSFLADD